MKKARHKKILSLINEYNIDRQEVLLEYLQKEGFNVTQATVSRDIKELNLVKIVASNGEYKYAQPIFVLVKLWANYCNIIVSVTFFPYHLAYMGNGKVYLPALGVEFSHFNSAVSYQTPAFALDKQIDTAQIFIQKANRIFH